MTVPASFLYSSWREARLQHIIKRAGQRVQGKTSSSSTLSTYGSMHTH